MAVTAPTPSATVRTTIAVKPESKRSRRAAYRTSAASVSIACSQPDARTSSLTARTLPTSTRAARRASSGDRPRSTWATVASSRYCCTSAATSASAAEPRKSARTPRNNWRGVMLYASAFSSRATADARRVQPSASASSRFRPALVMV